MKSNFRVLLLIFVCSVCQAEANKVGNGGNGVFCKDSNKKAQLLDFYESKTDFKTIEKNPEVIAKNQILKLQVSAPKLAAQYLKRLDEIKNEIDYKSDVKLTSIPDSKHLVEPLSPDCKVLQVAIRKPNPQSDEKRFLFQEDLWKQLGPVDKAGLFTHEIIYEHLAKLGEEDSIKARKVNSYLYKNEGQRPEFWKFIKDLEVPLYP